MNSLDHRTAVFSPTLEQRSQQFRIVIAGQIEKQYSFKKLKNADIKEFHKFLENTVNKKLTISEVDQLYLREKGILSDNREYIDAGILDEMGDPIKYIVIHYGKAGEPFRIFGYYDQKADFILTRIDPQHKKHKVR